MKIQEIKEKQEFNFNDTKFNNKPDLNIKLKLNLILFSLLSGILLSLSMPGFGYSFLAWFGFIPLFLILNQSKSYKNSILYSFLFGLGYTLSGLSWLLGLHPLKWLGFSSLQSISLVSLTWLYVSTYVACYICIFGVSAYFITKLKTLTIIKSLLIAFSWSIVINKMLSIGEFGFPWLLPEYSQYKNLPILQYAQYIGGIGIGFFLVLTNAVISFAVINIFSKQDNKKRGLLQLTAVIIILPLAYIVGSKLYNNASKPAKFAQVTAIQSNITVEQEKMGLIPASEIKEYFLSEISKAPSGIIVIPEAAILDFLRYKDVSLYNKLKDIAKNEQKTLIVGALDLEYSNGKLFPTNSAIIIDQNYSLDLVNVYHKKYLVPFGEYVPFQGFIPDFLKKLASTAAKADFVRGNSQKVIRTTNGNVAPSICYEIIFPDLIKAQVNKNADFLVNLSNLAWFHDSIIKDQFIAFSVMRAAEARKPIIVSVNTGNSIIVDFTGKIINIMQKNRKGSVTVKLGYSNEKSFYSSSIF